MYGFYSSVAHVVFRYHTLIVITVLVLYIIPATSDVSEAITNHQNFHLLPQSKCGTFVALDFIARGDIASPGQFPWIVRIDYFVKEYDRIIFICTGSLITSQYVLTAAHCFGLYKPGVRIRLCLGCTNLANTDSHMKIFEGESVITHDEFNNVSWIHDIALIRMEEETDFSIHVRPICLPLTVLPVNVDTKFTIAGFGNTEESFSSDLRYGVITYQEPRKCAHIFNITEDEENRICAGTKVGQDTCSGDSGGPLMYVDAGKFYEIGVVSSGVANCSKLVVSGVYTNVTTHILWILDRIKP